MIAASHDQRSAPKPGEAAAGADAHLFALIEQLRRCEKRRDLLLDRLAIEDCGGIDNAARKACDEARAVYRRIAAIRPTTATGVLRQLELTAGGWVAPSMVPTAMAALREIARRPPPLKVGKLPPVPPRAIAAAAAQAS